MAGDGQIHRQTARVSVSRASSRGQGSQIELGGSVLQVGAEFLPISPASEKAGGGRGEAVRAAAAPSPRAARE